MIIVGDIHSSIINSLSLDKRMLFFEDKHSSIVNLLFLIKMITFFTVVL